VSPTSYTPDEGTTSGDFSSSSMGSSTFSSDVNPTRPDDLYNIQNKFPTTSNRIPQQPNREQEATPTPHRPPPPPPPQSPPNDSKRPPSQFHLQRPSPHHHFESDTPDVHHPYPLGPDPFPDYFPQPHPPYHHYLDHFDEKSSHSPHFPGIYAQHAPSLHHPDRYYSHHPIDQQNYNVFPSGGGRYPDNGVAYNPNRKNGYQVTENAPDMPNGKGELNLCVNNLTQ
jgi:hypothetical protein